MRGDNDGLDRELSFDGNIPRPPKGLVIIGVLVLVALSILLTVFYTVEADEVAVVQRFGRYVRLEEPGAALQAAVRPGNRQQGEGGAHPHGRIRLSHGRTGRAHALQPALVSRRGDHAHRRPQRGRRGLDRAVSHLRPGAVPVRQPPTRGRLAPTWRRSSCAPWSGITPSPRC